MWSIVLFIYYVAYYLHDILDYFMLILSWNLHLRRALFSQLIYLILFIEWFDGYTAWYSNANAKIKNAFSAYIFMLYIHHTWL